MEIKETINKVVEGENLTESEASQAMEIVMEGGATEAQIAALIVSLRMKGETVEEISGMARAMRGKAQTIQSDAEGVLDTCGTGGDGAYTFNISTATALVAAGANVVVAKHGNRSVSSSCGSADVLEALGVKIDLSPPQVERCLKEIGLAFLFAPIFHPAMKYAVKPRREVGVRTVFNILGPLTNPASASYQLLGVYSSQLAVPLAKALGRLGVKKALVVHGCGGLDELSVEGENLVVEMAQGEVKEEKINPQKLGLKKCSKDLLKSGGVEESVQMMQEVLNGVEGPTREVVLLNTAAALLACEKASSWEEGLELAANSIDSGAALKKLNELVSFTQKVS